MKSNNNFQENLLIYNAQIARLRLNALFIINDSYYFSRICSISKAEIDSELELIIKLTANFETTPNMDPNKPELFLFFEYISYLYTLKNDFDTALKLLYKSVKFKQENNMNQLLDYTYLNICHIEMRKKTAFSAGLSNYVSSNYEQILNGKSKLNQKVALFFYLYDLYNCISTKIHDEALTKIFNIEVNLETLGSDAELVAYIEYQLKINKLRLLEFSKDTEAFLERKVLAESLLSLDYIKRNPIQFYKLCGHHLNNPTLDHVEKLNLLEKALICFELYSVITDQENLESFIKLEYELLYFHLLDWNFAKAEEFKEKLQFYFDFFIRSYPKSVSKLMNLYFKFTDAALALIWLRHKDVKRPYEELKAKLKEEPNSTAYMKVISEKRLEGKDFELKVEKVANTDSRMKLRIFLNNVYYNQQKKFSDNMFEIAKNVAYKGYRHKLDLGLVYNYLVYLFEQGIESEHYGFFTDVCFEMVSDFKYKMNNQRTFDCFIYLFKMGLSVMSNLNTQRFADFYKLYLSFNKLGQEEGFVNRKEIDLEVLNCAFLIKTNQIKEAVSSLIILEESKAISAGQLAKVKFNFGICLLKMSEKIKAVEKLKESGFLFAMTNNTLDKQILQLTTVL